MRLIGALGAAGLLLSGVDAVHSDQQVLNGNAIVHKEAPQRRPLYGRFLHITDFHPDSFYRVYSSTEKDSACHRGQGPAGIYGAETSECDTPLALVNETMKWVREQFRDSIDFVIWTGDSARHDSDDEHPRSRKEILDLNQFMVTKMVQTFGKENGDEDDEDPNNDFVVPIIPTFGNNDIMPHNIMVRGPNTWTRAYTDLWRQFIPEVQKHQFEQGGWFFVEVIPNKLAVFSLNTMYFFTNNAGVDGCAAHSEPGYRQMEWLRIQLQFMRARGMKAMLIGHVPPVRQEAKALFDETCWQKYALWLRQYRDVVVSSMYGHFNYDHFVLQDFHDIDADTENGAIGNYAQIGASDEDDFSAMVSSSYFTQLRDEWADLPSPPKGLKVGADDFEQSIMQRAYTWLCDHAPLSLAKKGKKDNDLKKRKRYLKKIGGAYAERFAASFVSASIVPNLYPTLRIFEYNITGLNTGEDVPLAADSPIEEYCIGCTDEVTTRKKKKNRKYRFTIPDPPAKTAPPGPAYSPQTFSLLRFTQYWANLTHINNDFTHEEEIEAEKWREGKHKGKKPHDKDHKPDPKPFKFSVLYDTKDDNVYNLTDLTMPNMLDLARRIGSFVSEDSITTTESYDGDDLESSKKRKKKHKKGKKHRKGKHEKDNLPWYTFVSRAFVETMSQDEIREEFGH